MRILKHFRPEKAIDKDVGRPELLNAHLDVERGVIEATDRHIVVRIPVEVEEGDVSGPVTADALTSSRRGTERVICEVDALVTDVASYRRPRPLSPFPDLTALIPEDEQVVWSVGVNAALLFRLATAMGADEVVLEFTGVGDVEDKLRPVRVTPLGKKSQGALGLLMPVRTGEVNYDGE